MNLSTIFTTRKRNLGQGNVFTGVCQPFCSQGKGISVQGVSLTETPPPDREPQTDTPLERDPPDRDPRPLPPYRKERAVRILPEFILVIFYEGNDF